MTFMPAEGINCAISGPQRSGSGRGATFPAERASIVCGLQFRFARKRTFLVPKIKSDIMRIVASSLSVLFAAACLAGCDDGNDGPSAKVTLEAGGENISITDARTVKFASTAPWTAAVEEGAAWLAVEPASGAAGEASITLTAGPNGTGADRTARVSVTPEGGPAAVITVTQPGAAAPRISELVIGDGYETHTVSLAYDAEGRISSLGDFRFEYGEDRLRVTADYTDEGDRTTEEYVYTLSGGRAVSVSGVETDHSIPETFYLAHTYVYSGDCLSGAEYTKPYAFTETNTWAEGNIVKIDRPDEEGYPVALSYGDTPNDANINLYALLDGILREDMDYAALAGLTGQRCSRLPVKATGTLVEINISYTPDDNGRLGKINIESPDDDSMEILITYM